MKNTIMRLVLCLMLSPAVLADAATWSGYVKLENVDNLHGGRRIGNVVNAAAKIAGTSYVTGSEYVPDGIYKFGILGATHTRSQSLYTSAIQNTSLLDAQREVRISNLSYESNLAPYITGRVGIMDLESYYDITEAATHLFNTAFVNAMALDKSTQLASFPYPGVGAMLEARNNQDYALLGLYQGNPQELHTFLYHGYMLIAEAGTKVSHFSVKAGAWIYQAGGTPDYNNARGAYFIGQQDWRTDSNRDMIAFMQFAFSDQKPKYIPYSLTLGVRSNNIFLDNNNDWLSAGIGKVWLCSLPSEVVYELSYAIRFYDYWYLKPDIQYIVKPNGIYSNATVFLLRLEYWF
jgi:porin